MTEGGGTLENRGAYVAGEGDAAEWLSNGIKAV